MVGVELIDEKLADEQAVIAKIENGLRRILCMKETELSSDLH